MTQEQGAVLREHSNSYNIFILVLTILSLVVMGLLLLPLSPATHERSGSTTTSSASSSWPTSRTT